MSPRTRAYYIHAQDTVPVYARRVLSVARAMAHYSAKFTLLTCAFLGAVILGFLEASRGR